ncbi:MAG: hypothetical protein BJ554DRAFT_3968 [Olpidium bornovanus]|uniref:Uncharacterized protein n=1 Tax=Olpidium bornovanus TaxID=278681 RepID=A0A8H8A056_9FUNG|nr:MAG: hypothetical protein BJ554DRAFT_3968 [Olpidium bornovanus]
MRPSSPSPLPSSLPSSASSTDRPPPRCSFRKERTRERPPTAPGRFPPPVCPRAFSPPRPRPMDDAADTGQRVAAAPHLQQQQQRRQDQRQGLPQQQQQQQGGGNSLAEQQQQQQQSMGPAAATPEQLLSSAFRNAAMSVTQLYKDSLKLTRRAYQEGYVLALQDLVTLLRERGDERSGLAVPLSDLYRFTSERYAQATVDDDAAAPASGRSVSLANPPDDGSVVAIVPEQHPSGETTSHELTPSQHQQPQQQQQQPEHHRRHHQQAEMQDPAQFTFAPASPSPAAPAVVENLNVSGHALRPQPHQMQQQELAFNGLSLDDQLALPSSFEGGGISLGPLGETRKRRYVNTGFAATPPAQTLRAVLLVRRWFTIALRDAVRGRTAAEEGVSASAYLAPVRINEDPVGIFT